MTFTRAALVDCFEGAQEQEMMQIETTVFEERKC